MMHSLAGYLLDDHGRIGWLLEGGTDAHKRVFYVDRNVGLKMFKEAAGKLTDLVIGHDLFRVYITSTTAGTSPHNIGLVVQDTRWLLNRKTIIRDFNRRRRTGEIRLIGEGRLEDRARVPDETYHAWSMNGKSPWTVRDALINILDEILGAKFDSQGKKISEALYEIPDLPREIPFENVIIRDPGDIAIAKVMARVPGYQLYVRRDGKISVKDDLDGSEGGVVASAGPIVPKTGSYVVADRRFELPVQIRVLFDREVELRFDGIERDTEPDREDNFEPRLMENVLPSPDVEVEVAGRKVGQNEYMTYQEAFEAWEDDWPDTSAPFNPLSFARMRRYHTAPERMKLYTLPAKGTKPDRVLAGRIGRAQQHIRRRYRIIPEWMSKIRSLRASRVAIYDRESGARASSKAYHDWTEVPTERGLDITSDDVANTETWGYEGYADRLEDATAAPGEVRLIDGELGILDIVHSLDGEGKTARVIPGLLVDPEGEIGLGPQISAAKAYAATLAGFSLAEGFKVATVVTALQGSPNNTGRMHEVIIKPAHVRDLVGDVGEALGPEITIHIPPGDTTTARFAWSDDFSIEIQTAFFFGGQISESLLVNKEQVDQIATAAAAAIYELLAPRFEGSATHPQAPGLEPTGAVKSVETSTTPRGSPLTKLAIPRRQAKRSILSLLPEETLLAIERIVQP